MQIKRFILLIILLFTTPAYAVWSGFAALSKETSIHSATTKPQIEVLSTSDIQNKICSVKIYPKAEYPSKQAWLVVAKKQLSIDEQKKLRNVIWGYAKKPEFLALITKLAVLQNNPYPQKNQEINLYEVSLDYSMAEQVYVFIDYPGPVLDGGYYYSIDINSYCTNDN